MAKRSTGVSTRQHEAGSPRKTVVLAAVKRLPNEGPLVTPSQRSRASKMVYYFGATRTEGSTDMKAILGGKGANLADMTSIGLPVPPGFTITTDTCAAYYAAGQRLPYGLMNEVRQHISVLEAETEKKLGDNANPLRCARW